MKSSDESLFLNGEALRFMPGASPYQLMLIKCHVSSMIMYYFRDA